MIDILLSTYNGEKFIREQIDSILTQTHSDWKLIIRDDCSKDNTANIINEYAQKFPEKISILKSTRNLGCKKSFEELLKSSTSEYVMFSDQDDFWLPEKVQHAYEMIKKEEDENQGKAIICSTDLTVVDENLNILNNSYWEYSKIRPDLLQSQEMLSVNNYVTGCTMIINAKARETSLPFGEKALLHDSYIALKVKKEGGIIKYSRKNYIYYRQHGSNEVGAIKITYNHKYFLKKISNIKHVIHSQYENYLQANEVNGISLVSFFIHRVIYLIKR